MKKLLCALTALALLGCAALAETQIIEKPEIIIEMITPSPSPEPVGETFSSEDLIVTLPAGMIILNPAGREGYDAAVRFDFPAAGEALLLAVDEATGAALAFCVLESEESADTAARSAALSMLGADSTVEEMAFGENSFSAFSCAIGSDAFRLFFLSDGERLLCVGASGLEEDALSAMLTGLSF